MGAHHILNEKQTELKQKQHQNLNNLFYMIPDGACQNMLTDCSRLRRLLISSRQTAGNVP